MNGTWVGGILVGAALAGVVMLVGCGHTQGPWGCHGGGHHKADWFVNHVSQELTLTEAQKEKLIALKNAILAKKSELKDIHESMRTEIRTQLLLPTIDQEKLQTAILSRQTQHEAFLKFCIAQYADFHATLTQEQRERFVKKLDELHERLTDNCK